MTPSIDHLLRKVTQSVAHRVILHSSVSIAPRAINVRRAPMHSHVLAIMLVLKVNPALAGRVDRRVASLNLMGIRQDQIRPRHDTAAFSFLHHVATGFLTRLHAAGSVG